MSIARSRFNKKPVMPLWSPSQAQSESFNSGKPYKFDPTHVTDTVLYLNPSGERVITKDGSDLVSQYDDQGSGGHNAVQATGANQATFTQEAINGQPALVTSSSSGFMTIPDHADFKFDGGDGYSIFMVCDFDGYVSHGSIFNAFMSKGDMLIASDHYSVGTNSSNLLYFHSGNNEEIRVETFTINGNPHIYSTVMDNAGTRADVWVDANQNTNNAATVGSDNVTDLHLFGDSSGLRYSDGKYGAIAVVKRDVTATEGYEFRRWLSKTYRISL